MNILVLNGSPRGSKSNTLKITEAFIEGLESQSTHEITRIEVKEKKIGHCLGCFACWKDTPGTCVIKDDMSEILSLIIKAELVIWSFPLYYFSMPSKIKALMDRMLPLNLPFMDEKPEGGATHPSRYDLSGQRTVLISTCGFYSRTHNYDALETQFEIAFGKNNLTNILCPEGELFSQAPLRTRTDEYLGYVRTAGAQYAESGSISSETHTELSRLLFPKELFTTLANASWGIERENGNLKKIYTDAGYGDEPGTTEDLQNAPQDPSVFFIRQMAALYNPRGLAGKEAILEFHFTDIDSTHRLLLGKTECTVLTTTSQTQSAGDPPCTRIETPFSVWQEIGEGKLDGATAMMQGKYRVLGNFDLMLKMDGLFAGPDTTESNMEKTTTSSSSESKKRNMSLVILPWLPLWIALPISTTAGLLATLTALVLFQLAGFKWKIGTHERITLANISLFAVAIVAGIPPYILIPLSYAVFGAQWLLSSLFPVPLTAHYSGADYGGDAALQNPLFIKTNRIITIVWGVLYLVTASWTWFLLSSPLAPFTGAINSITPALCGLWTAWFPKWYIAKVAAGK